MASLYREIHRLGGREEGGEEDLAAISRLLLREERLTGAFFCEPEVFTDIYNLEARSIARSGRSVNLGMISASMRDGSTAPLRLLNSYMEKLEDCIQATLRRGDVVTQYSASQYLLLLPAPSPEKGAAGPGPHSCELYGKISALPAAAAHRHPGGGHHSGLAEEGDIPWNCH